VVAGLLARGTPVRAVTRSRQAISTRAGLDLACVDLQAPGAASAVMDGVEAVFINARACGPAIEEVATAAATAGARRVVALAALNVDWPTERQPSRLRGDRNREAGDAVVGSGLEWASLRPGVFAMNVLPAACTPREPAMNVTIVGAAGGTGRQLLEQSVHAGHSVTVVARTTTALPSTVRCFQSDLSDPGMPPLEAAVRGVDAVLSALGPRSKDDARTRTITRAIRAIITAMQNSGTDRLLVVSAAPVASTPSSARDPGDGPLTRYVLTPLVKAAVKDTYLDLATMEDRPARRGALLGVEQPGPHRSDHDGGGVARHES
jgi:putative NADH-flavin reductase